MNYTYNVIKFIKKYYFIICDNNSNHIDYFNFMTFIFYYSIKYNYVIFI